MAKNKDGFIDYYNQFKNKIYNYFWYRVGFDRQTAEDLTSETFIKAWKNFDDFDGERPFGPWMFTVARNHLINYYKVAKRETTLTDKENFLPAPADNTVDRLELERVIELIRLMEDNDREVLLLRFVDGFSNGEIAALLDKEEGAVRTQISRGLAKLRAQLKE